MDAWKTRPFRCRIAIILSRERPVCPRRIDNFQGGGVGRPVPGRSRRKLQGQDRIELQNRPVPLKLAGCGLPGALSVIDNVEVWVPDFRRSKVTSIVQPAPAAGIRYILVIWYDGAIMMAKTQITLETEMQRRARQRANDLGVSLAEYFRRLVARDLARPETAAHVDRVFDLGSSGGSDIASQKHSMIADAFHSTRRKLRRR